MDKKFLSYFTADKASDKQSLFDLSHHNLLSGSFGGLTCTFWDKVLAKDYYKIAASTQSKGAALSSPTFTELKSNDYAFFTPCQVIWKHWNDYFTNGTEFANTYGSNRNNQDLQGLWVEPQIPVNYLQFIGKVGKGYALPAYRFNFLDVVAHLSLDSSLPDQFYVLGNSGNVEHVPIVDIFRYILFWKPDLISGLEGITIDPNPVVPLQLHGSVPSQKLNFLTFPTSDIFFYVYGSPDDVRNFQHVFMGESDLITPPTLNKDNLTISTETSIQDFVIFSDNNSTKPRFSESPFLITYKQKPVNLFGNTVSLSYVSYSKRLGITDKHDYSFKELMSYSSPLIEVKDSSFLTIRDKNFFYKSVINFSDISFNGTYVGNEGILFGENFQYFVLNPSQTFNFSVFENEYFPVSFMNQILNSGLDIPQFFDATINTNTPSDSPFDPYEPQQFFANGANKAIYSPGLNVTFNNREFFYMDILGNLSTPPLVSLFHWVYQTSGYYGINPLLFDSQANVLGYTQFAFFIYLYQNCCKHLDYTGLPLDTFVPRSFKPYARERISALPYFAYSKIWNEYFRNRTVSSPEFDYSETNGLIFQSRNYVNYYNTYPIPVTPSEALEKYNSWVIPFACTPKSGINDDLSEIDNNLFLNFENNLHYFNVNNSSNMLSLLTGYQLNMHVLNQLIAPLITQKTYKYVAGFVYSHFVLPNYYNGLLHYKYQNFTKDYFSSALLDPMSGANQELIPQTVTELRTAQAKQSFWERTAVARSIKKFYEMMVGTTPTHIEYDKPLLLGSDHQNVQVSEVIQTSETDSTPLGSRAGIIADFGKGGLCSHFFNEPGIIMVLHSITVDAQYMQGLQKKFTPYESYLDYPFTQFAHIGNESIFMRELNFTSNAIGTNNLSQTQAYLQAREKDTSGVVGIPRSSILNNPMYVSPVPISTHPNMVEVTSDQLDAVFGYIPRFSSYKFAFDEVHGDFRDIMDFWHTFREFHYMPYLSHEFVNYESALRDSNLERIFAVLEDSDKFWQSIHFYITVKRSIPYYTVPKSSVN